MVLHQVSRGCCVRGRGTVILVTSQCKFLQLVWCDTMLLELVYNHLGVHVAVGAQYSLRIITFFLNLIIHSVNQLIHNSG